MIAIENVRLFDEVQARTKELTEALEQQTATSEVLQVISSSPGDLRPVFEAMLEKATRICGAKFGNMLLHENGEVRRVAIYGASPEWAAEQMNATFRPGAGGTLDRVFSTKQPVHTTDLTAEQIYIDRLPGIVDLVEGAGARTALNVPMLKDNEVVGVITIYRQEVRPFSDKQVELLTNFARQAVIAIENARLLGELRQRTADLTESLEQQTATSEVLQVISSSPGELQPVFDAMLERATRVCGARFGTLLLYEGGNRFRPTSTYGVPAAFAQAQRDRPTFQAPDPNYGLGLLAASKQAVHNEDLAEEWVRTGKPDTTRALVELGGARTFLGVPMLKEGELVGALGIYRQEVRPFSEKQIELVENFAAQAVIAIENARLLNELRESLEQQTATSEVLQVISSSPGELEPVFETMLANATRICEAVFGSMLLYEGDAFRRVAIHNAPPAFAKINETSPVVPVHGNPTLTRLVTTRQPVHVADLVVEGPNEPIARYAGARTLLTVPMLKEGELIGALGIYRQEVRPFTDKQVELLSNFAKQAVIAIENARLLKELRERTAELARSVEELRALGQVSQAVNSTLDLTTVLSTIVSRAVQLSGTDAGTIYEFDKAQQALQLRSSYGMTEPLVEMFRNRHLGVGEQIIDRALRSREPVQIEDLLSFPVSPTQEILVRAGYRGGAGRTFARTRPYHRRAGGPPQTARRVSAEHRRPVEDVRRPVGAGDPERAPVHARSTRRAGSSRSRASTSRSSWPT